MREILFRGKDADNGEWVYGYYAHFENIHDVKVDIIYTGYADMHMGSILPECYDVNPKTIGQYTGLTDKNGTRIFEGDIVDIIPEDEPSVIKWDDDSARFVIINSCERDFDNYWGHELEIIGNIHDNPELLEG